MLGKALEFTRRAEAERPTAFPHDQQPIRRRTLKCSDGHEIAYIEMLNWIALATVCTGSR
jgi:hypothetical protein